MVRSKVTITLDREKAAKAATLIGGRSVSEVVDVALNRLIATEALRQDVAAYIGQPPDEDEWGLGELAVEFDLADQDVDYQALYGTRR